MACTIAKSRICDQLLYESYPALRDAGQTASVRQVRLCAPLQQLYQPVRHVAAFFVIRLYA